jgi:hypothetical protein
MIFLRAVGAAGEVADCEQQQLQGGIYRRSQVRSARPRRDASPAMVRATGWLVLRLISGGHAAQNPEVTVLLSVPLMCHAQGWDRYGTAIGRITTTRFTDAYAK